MTGWAVEARSPARNWRMASFLLRGCSWATAAVAELRTASMAPSTSPRMSFDMGSSLVEGVVPFAVGAEPVPGR